MKININERRLVIKIVNMEMSNEDYEMKIKDDEYDD